MSVYKQTHSIYLNIFRLINRYYNTNVGPNLPPQYYLDKFCKSFTKSVSVFEKFS